MLIGFFALWLILCGKITAEIVVVDLIATAGIFCFTCKFCRWSLEKERIFIRLLFPGLAYVALLIREIIAANVAMLGIVLSPGKSKVDPVLIRIHVPLKTNIAKMTLANSITLTPGTITVENSSENYVIHCINPAFSRDVDCSAFVDALKHMEELAGVEEEAA